MLKRVVLGVLVLPVLLLALLAAFIWLDSDLKHTRQQIQSSFKQVTGHNLVLNGDLSLQFWPLTRFVSQQITVTDDQGQLLFNAGLLVVEVDPLTIIHGDLAVHQLVLENAEIHIVRKKPDDPVSQDENASQAGVWPDKGSSGFPFKRIGVINSKVHIDDQQNNKQYVLDKVQFSVNLINRNQLVAESSFDFRLDDRLNGSVIAATGLQIGEQLKFEESEVGLQLSVDDRLLDLKLTGEFSLTSQGQLVQARDIILTSGFAGLKASSSARKNFENLEIKVLIDSFNPSAIVGLLPELKDTELPENILHFLSAELTATVTAAETRIDISSLMLDNTHAQGSMILSAENKKFQFKIEQIQAEPYLRLLSVLPYQSTGEKEEETGELTAAVTFNRIIFEQGRLENADTRIHLDDSELISIQGKFSAQEINLNSLLKPFAKVVAGNVYMQKMRNGQAFSLIHGTINYQYSKDLLSVADVDLKIDDTTIKGDVEYLFHEPLIHSNLQIGKLDLDRYQHLFFEKQQREKIREKSPVLPAPVIDGLKQLKGSGSIEIESLRYLETDYEGISIRFNDS